MKNIRSLSGKQTEKIVSGVSITVGEALFLFTSARQHPEWEGRRGGYFCLADAETGLPFLVAPVGGVRIEKAEKYLSFCQEKARRLAKHPNHVSSWESRNPDAEQWGGAVRVSGLIFSFSGLPEPGDEAVMLAEAWAYNLGITDVLEELHAIAARSNNEFWGPLFKFLSRDI